MGELRASLEELRAGVRVPAGKSTRIVLVRQVKRVRLVGMFFDLDKCFLLPSAMHGIREIKKQYDQHPGSNLLVVGHTDTSGQDAHNLDLSVERADAVAAYLTDDVAKWEGFFGTGTPEGKRWGLLEVQHMLTALPEGGPPFFAGKPNGKDDASHRAAVKAFQKDQGLTEDGIAGPVTRKSLIETYMGLDGTTLPDDVKLTAHGCGENFPADQTGDGKRAADNRRVEIFFFDGPISPAPPGTTSARGSTEYPRWLAAVKQTIDVGLGTASATALLESRYALERFEKLAESLEEEEFVGWASMTYGTDIPLDAYKALRKDLVGKKLIAPDIQLVPGGIDGKDSAYDNATQVIGVKESIAIDAETVPAAAGKLIALLMHEFGHHVDHLLRHKFSQVGGDAAGEEGSFFAYGITAMHHLDTDHVPFARLEKRDGQSVELALDFPEFRAAVQKYLSDPQEQEDAKRATVEFFGAGRGNSAFPKASFGHRSIEDGLKTADKDFFDDTVRDQIYFGNWLRDFSQFNDPAWLRFMKNRFVNAVKPARDLMTEILDLGAHKDFNPTSTPSQHVAGLFHVTTDKLGVYRPEEHIDNPEGLNGDGAAIDPSLFHGPVPPGVPNPETAVDANGLKAYIATRGAAFRSAADFIDSSLRRARAAGPTPEGRRLFGQALHTLEDLFAHSNFVELTLVRLGHVQVYCWVGPLARVTVVRNGQPRVRIPMVTGVFGSVDTGISAASAIGEALQHPIECKAGEYSPASVAILKLLEAVTADGAKSIESLFAKVKELEKKYPEYATFMCRATDSIRERIRGRMGTAMREEIKRLGQAEADFFNDPTSTAPTHSQLAKDHDDHPLHVIAAECAKLMVADVGTNMNNAWGGSVTDDVLVARALRYLVHPDDIDVRVAPGPGQLVGLIQAFANTSPAVIKSLDFPTSKARFLKTASAERERQLGEAREMYANNDTNADRNAELTVLV